jgi:MoaA/NifB/PqqE/SkfB family radical SAM enzyme
MESKQPCYQQLQIELTSRCNLSCSTCLRAVAGIRLQEQDLSPASIVQLQPALQRTAAVHLQGWGESMLLADLPDRIRWFKKQGCLVSFSTSGSLMNRERAADLVRSGLDSITFSMAGATVSVQDGLRGAGTHVKLWQSMRLMGEIKEELASPLPSLAVSYLLTRDTLAELPLAVKQCRGLGVRLFAGVHLTHAGTVRQQEMALFGSGLGQDKSEIRKNVIKANWQALLAGIRLQLPLFKPELLPVCAKNPVNSSFIGADGAVAPCVFLCPPRSNKAEQWFTAKGIRKAGSKRFGSLNRESLDQIWQSREYRTFRRVFQLRQQVYDREMAKVGLGMDGLERLERSKKRIRAAFTDLPVPECCVSCPKMKGY